MRRRSSGGLCCTDAVEPAGVVYGWGGDMVETGGDAAMQRDKPREVGKEAGGLVLLDLAVLYWFAAKVWG